MSHELRTPLSVILGYTDVLADAVADSDARLVVDRIRVAGSELLDLVETTLDLNRLESGHDVTEVTPVSMRTLCEELAVQYAAVRKSSAVALRWAVQGTPVALADPRKLRIIVKNLVGNALKFTQHGEVCVSVRATGDCCLVVVRDSGIGIPTDQLPSIFEMFHQIDGTDRRGFGGVGLGLYIVRKLTEQLGATLDVRSVVGKGTTFTVSLRLAARSETAAAA
jgi:signal transduction histidine kinase